MFDDGKLKIYQKLVSNENSGIMDNQPTKLVGTAFYGELSFTANEYYAAKQAETEIVKRVRIHQDKSICNKHIIVIGETPYEVGRTFSTLDKGIAITDISLERVTTNYDIDGISNNLKDVGDSSCAV